MKKTVIEQAVISKEIEQMIYGLQYNDNELIKVRQEQLLKLSDEILNVYPDSGKVEVLILLKSIRDLFTILKTDA